MDPESLRELLGLDNLTDEERKAKGDRLLRELPVDHLINGDGKVYISLEQLIEMLVGFANAMVLRGAVLKDRDSIAAGAGIEMVTETLDEINGELLRREVAKIFNISL